MVRVNSGLSVWLFIGTSMIVIFFFLLLNIDSTGANSQQFNATQVFFTLLIASAFMLVMLMVLQFLQHPTARQIYQQNLVLFFFKDWAWKKLLWIPLGLVLVFGGAILGSIVNEPVLSIGIAGVILLIALFRTNNVIIPIVIHGIYNATIVILQSGLIFPASLTIQLDLSSTFVTILGNNLTQNTGLINEVVFQVFLVAVAEEIFKVFIISFVLVLAEGRFDTKNSTITYFAGAVALAVWVSDHLLANHYT